MGWVLMVLCSFLFGGLMGLVIKNPLIAVILGGLGGWAIGTLFQSAGLLS